MTLLSGAGWELKSFLGEDWIGRRSHAPDTRDRLGWIPAEVPGSILADLVRAGEVGDPYVAQGSLLVEWVPARTWVVRRRFRAPAAGAGTGAGRRVAFRLEGIDHAGRVFLDGEEIGRSEGMFRPVQIEIGDRLEPGAEAHLAVVIEPAPACEPQVGRTSRVRIHKSRMSYGWDFCPRMIHLGLWDDVSLVETGPIRIEDVWARPVLSPARAIERARAEVRLQIDVSAAAAGTLEVELVEEGEAAASPCAVGRVEIAAGQERAELVLEIARPRLWWPRGAGPQPLYRARVVARAGGTVSHERSVRFGVRHLELTGNDTPDRTARPYTLCVNGERLYIKGWNWVPLDVLHGPRRPDKLGHLLRLAARAGVNLLRVWGGGLLEREEFYDRCDELGILVWQELALSSSVVESTPSEDPDYVALMEEEARAIVPRRRNHPSLALWCGGNELQTPDGRPLGGDAPVLAAMESVVRALDPNRPWLPTSPSGRVFMNRLAEIERDPDGLHDVHGPWEHQGPAAHYRLYDRGTALLSSEFGVEGMTNRRALEALIPAAQRWPAGRENPVYAHLGAWWNNLPLVEQAFGRFDGPGELDALRRASQFLQADGLRYAVESCRRRAWRSSGTIPWQLNESYPNAWCTAAVDYHGDPKPAYHAVRRAYQALVVCAAIDRQVGVGPDAVEAALWVVADREEPAAEEGPWHVVATLRGDDGAVIAAVQLELDPPRAGACSAGTARLPLPPRRDGDAVDGGDGSAGDLLLVDLSLLDPADGVRAENRYYLTRGADLSCMRRLATTALEARAMPGALELVNAGRTVALLIDLEDGRPLGSPGWIRPADSGFSLLPGEARRIAIDADGIRPGPALLRISAWNAEPIELALAPD